MLASLAAAATLLGTFEPVRAQKGSGGGEWRTYGGDLGNSKYSPLDQINRDNFSKLQIAWRWRSADGFLSRSLPGGGELSGSSRVIFDSLRRDDPKRWRDDQAPSITNFKATPLMIGGRLYLNTPLSIGAAVDAKTGDTLWVYNPKSYEAGTTTMTARWNQRGVAYWSDGKDERIYWGTGDGYLVAVDARTGAPVTSFGDRGRVDLMQGLPRAVRGSRDWLNALTYSVQSPPVIVRNTVITPASISSYNNIKEQIPGWTRGWDVRTGKLKWTFHTVPRPGEFGNETWLDDSWSFTGKVSGWTVFSADEELGYVYLPYNTAAPDYYGGHRPGDGLFGESLVCLDAETGKRVWHYQFVKHGLWDYDLPAAPNLIDVTMGGQKIRAVAQVTKHGFLFAFDRVSGKPLWPI
jgi:quinoprotein glucose dehydrogenase